jgi:hypothetical protein
MNPIKLNFYSLKMVATDSSEGLVRTYQTTLHHTPEVRNFYIPRRKNLETRLDASLYGYNYHLQYPTSLCEIYCSS